MIEYQAFMHLNNIIPLNMKLAEIVKEVNRLSLALDELKAVSRDDTSTSDSAQTIVVNVDSVFDWEASDDKAALKGYALGELGLSIKGNKSPETIKSEIREFLAANEVD